MVVKKCISKLLSASLIISSFALVAPVSVKAAEATISDSLVLEVGESAKIVCTPKKLVKKIKWKSTDKTIATVNKKGKVTGKSEGSTTIVASVKKKEMTCAVTVKKKELDISNLFPIVPKETCEAEDVYLVEREKFPTTDDWDTARLSGEISDYEKYFTINRDDYYVANENQGELVKIEYSSKIYESPREAYVYLPYGYDETKTYPVVYVLHGIGCDGTQWTSMGATRALDNMIARGETSPVIAVFPSVVPDGGLKTGGVTPENIVPFTNFEREFIYDLEPYMYENYSVSHDKKYTGICGLSMGGMEALCTGFTLQGYFNYIGSFSAAPTLNLDLLKINDKADTPELVMLCSGTADSTVQDNPKTYHETLSKNGVDHIWYQYPNGGHSPNVWENGFVNFMKMSF